MSLQEKEAELCARFEAAIESRSSDPEFARRGRYLSSSFTVGIGATRYLIRITEGRVDECTRSIPLFRTTDFHISGSLPAWERLWEPMPRAGWHDIFALTKAKEMHVEGDTRLFFAHLQYIKDLLALPRVAAVA